MIVVAVLAIILGFVAWMEQRRALFGIREVAREKDRGASGFRRVDNAAVDGAVGLLALLLAF